MTASLAEDAFDRAGAFWYDRAKKYFDAFGGDSTQYLDQARIWLGEYDFGLAEIAWNLVKMERENEGTVG